MQNLLSGEPFASPAQSGTPQDKGSAQPRGASPLSSAKPAPLNLNALGALLGRSGDDDHTVSESADGTWEKLEQGDGDDSLRRTRTTTSSVLVSSVIIWCVAHSSTDKV